MKTAANIICDALLQNREQATLGQNDFFDIIVKSTLSVVSWY